jgi:Ni,Fe-hydrogenase III small subunit
MFDFIRTRLQQGKRTISFPDGAGDLLNDFAGCRFASAAVLERRATAQRSVDNRRAGSAGTGYRACLFSPEEAGCTRRRHDRVHAGLSTGNIKPRADDGRERGRLAHALDAEMRRLFGRSLRLRSVVAGSCGGCEAELVALGNVVFDLARFGVQFVASPRHADGIVITGTVNRNMRAALQRTYDATPTPRIVIAVGACAIAGGPFAESREANEGLPPDLHVDLYVPGCPPHPLTLLDGLLRMLGRLPKERGSTTRG